MSENYNYESKILKAVEKVNEKQKQILVHKAKEYFRENLKGKIFAIWGLSFKPKTDDMREAPSIVIINGLIKAGAIIHAYDPVAMKEAKRIFGDNNKIKYFSGNYEALKGANALMLITEWNQFRFPDFRKIKKLLKEPIIFDGRNQYNPDELKELGFTYFSIGR